MIDLTLPPGLQPAALVAEVLVDVVDRRADTRHQPPQLQPAIEAARQAQQVDDVDALDLALLDVAVAAMASLVRLRAALPCPLPRGGP